ncbi:hypothetical protein HPB47_011003 [Ixodes persulcatus]|uniref:Uncharacterized protein n=1 Tax=Ixodes persulcatus TaxID=34615 RepID=A0AC60NXG4_IXOPE|nr:hypothetical protein HPB47_011003 [Ixodes persulcatus]
MAGVASDLEDDSAKPADLRVSQNRRRRRDSDGEGVVAKSASAQSSSSFCISELIGRPNRQGHQRHEKLRHHHHDRHHQEHEQRNHHHPLQQQRHRRYMVDDKDAEDEEEGRCGTAETMESVRSATAEAEAAMPGHGFPVLLDAAVLRSEVISSVPQHQFYIDNNIVQGSLATSRWLDGGQDYSDSLNLTRASTDFGRCDLPLYEHWSGNAVVYNLQKADSPSLLLGRGTGAAMTVPFTKFLLLTQLSVRTIPERRDETRSFPRMREAGPFEYFFAVISTEKVDTTRLTSETDAERSRNHDNVSVYHRIWTRGD